MPVDRTVPYDSARIVALLGQVPDVAQAVALVRDLATAEPGAKGRERAAILLDLSRRLSEAGQKEAALAAAEEAVAIRRSLVMGADDTNEDNRVALALSLGVPRDSRRAVGDPASAFADASEAVLLLAPPSLAKPDALGARMAEILQGYLGCAADAGAEPHWDTMEPVVAVLAARGFVRVSPGSDGVA